MKHFLFLICFWAALTLSSQAHPVERLTNYLQSAKSVYLAEVTSYDASTNKITFSIKDVLRGNPATTLTLSAGGGLSYLPKSEWLLVSCSHGFNENSVGWASKGDYGWIPGFVVRKDNEIYVKDWGSSYTLTEIKEFLEKNPPKN